MRLWSIHPKYLDRQGLLAVWRESLLAKAVLEANTRGYKNHPQLIRFRQSQNPLISINKYLEYIFIESQSRNYQFDETKFIQYPDNVKIPITSGQLEFEFAHLLKKLQIRSPLLYSKLKDTNEIAPHPIFTLIIGEKEDWEK